DVLVFFFNDTATTEIYTLSLHDALPISERDSAQPWSLKKSFTRLVRSAKTDRKSTRLNSSHPVISYAVFCLNKRQQQAGVGPLGRRAQGHVARPAGATVRWPRPARPPPCGPDDYHALYRAFRFFF